MTMSEQQVGCVRISYDPGTGRTAIDDRWTAPDGMTHGALGVYLEPDGAAGASATARVYAAGGWMVELGLQGTGIDQSQVA